MLILLFFIFGWHPTTTVDSGGKLASARRPFFGCACTPVAGHQPVGLGFIPAVVYAAALAKSQCAEPNRIISGRLLVDQASESHITLPVPSDLGGVWTTIKTNEYGLKICFEEGRRFNLPERMASYYYKRQEY
jgi:hypothetical protein